MSKYTLQIHGEPLEDAVIALDPIGGVRAPSATEWAANPQEVLNVTVDAPSLDEAKAKLSGALPEHGSYSVERPDPLEEDEDDQSFL